MVSNKPGATFDTVTDSIYCLSGMNTAYWRLRKTQNPWGTRLVHWTMFEPDGKLNENIDDLQPILALTRMTENSEVSYKAPKRRIDLSTYKDQTEPWRKKELSDESEDE